MMPVIIRALTFVGLIAIALTLWRHAQGLDIHRNAFLSASLKPLQKTFGTDPKNVVARRRVVAVADLHGDLEHAHNVLRMANLIDNDPHEPNWIGGRDILVSTGDIVDRGDDTIPLYRMFQRLRTQAHAEGGAVRNCIGNHEMMNAMHDWRYVTTGDMDSFGGPVDRRHVISSKGWIGQDWLSNYSVSHTIDLLPRSSIPSDLKRFYDVPRANFVHGGIDVRWAEQGLQHINEIGHSLLRKSLSEERPEGWLPSDATKEEAEFYDEHGPLWYRGYALDDEKDVCKDADEARLRLGGVRFLVVGHTPHLSGFVVRCRGSVLLIDTGISRAYGGEQSALIFDTTLTNAIGSLNGKSSWQEQLTISALYRGRMPKIIDTQSRSIEV